MPGQMVFILPVLYIVLQWGALNWMRNGWQMAALIPALAVGATLGVMAVGIVIGADVAALAPMLGLPLATFYLLILWPIYMIRMRQP